MIDLMTLNDFTHFYRLTSLLLEYHGNLLIFCLWLTSWFISWIQKGQAWTLWRFYNLLRLQAAAAMKDQKAERKSVHRGSFPSTAMLSMPRRTTKQPLACRAKVLSVSCTKTSLPEATPQPTTTSTAVTSIRRTRIYPRPQRPVLTTAPLLNYKPNSNNNNRHFFISPEMVNPCLLLI